MRFRTGYTLNFLAPLPRGFAMPLQVQIAEYTFRLDGLDDVRTSAIAVVEGSVNVGGLTAREGPRPLDGTAPDRGIFVPEQAAMGQFLSSMAHTLSFIMDIPIRYASRLDMEELIPETPDEECHLRTLGTSNVYKLLTAIPRVRSIHMPQVDDEVFATILRKEPGIALYAQALLLQQTTAVFGELWKVLESAFNAKDGALLRYLADFGPSKELGFTMAEFKELLVIRGRASHAESRSGIKELRAVRDEVEQRLGRLKCLVEQVVVTKKTWGTRTLETERLTPISSFIGPNGEVVLFTRMGGD